MAGEGVDASPCVQYIPSATRRKSGVVEKKTNRHEEESCATVSPHASQRCAQRDQIVHSQPAPPPTTHSNTKKAVATSGEDAKVPTRNEKRPREQAHQHGGASRTALHNARLKNNALLEVELQQTRGSSNRPPCQLAPSELSLKPRTRRTPQNYNPAKT